MKTVCIAALKEVVPEAGLPTSLDSIIKKMEKLPRYMTHWRLSSARAGISRALSLVKAHHPDIDIKTITSGIPERKDDGSEFSKDDFRVISESLRGITTWLAGSLRLEKFFNAYDMEGKMVTVTISSKTGKTPSTSTPSMREAACPNAPTDGAQSHP
jgi:hypothetical protein